MPTETSERCARCDRKECDVESSKEITAMERAALERLLNAVDKGLAISEYDRTVINAGSNRRLAAEDACAAAKVDWRAVAKHLAEDLADEYGSGDPQVQIDGAKERVRADRA